MLKNKKMLILIVITIAIIIAGGITFWKSGFKYGLKYGENTRIELKLGFNFDQTELELIAKEIFGEYKIQKANVTNDTAIITVKSISEDQKANLLEKVNEEYGLELTEESLNVSSIGALDIQTIITQYVWIIVIATAIIEVYLIIRFRNIEIKTVIFVSLLVLILSQILAISLITILRIELGIVVMPMLLAIFIIDWYIITTSFEEKLQKIAKNDKKNKQK